MQPKTRAVIALDALGLAVLAALFVFWCARTPGLSVPGGIAAGCSAALFAAVGLRFVPAWVRFWQRGDDAPAVPAAEPAHMGVRIFAMLLALDLVLLLLTWGIRTLAGQPETLTQALEFWRGTDSRHYLDIARDYEAAGADCISCLTEPKWFLGSDDIFREIRAAVSTPMLRKDFTVSDYQLYQSRLMGANCVLLICALLDTKTLAQYLAVCDELGLSALVETHDADEIRSAVAAGAKIIGVNNRNLKDFSVDFSNAARLRDRIPPEAVYVAESGVQSVQDVAALRSIGADAVLIGETLMRASDKARRLAELRGNL